MRIPAYERCEYIPLAIEFIPMWLTKQGYRVIYPAARHTEHNDIQVFKIDHRAVIVLANGEVFFIAIQAINEALQIIPALFFNTIPIIAPVSRPENRQVCSAGYFIGLSIIEKPSLKFMLIIFRVRVCLLNPEFDWGI
jgi:hypothetical protein